MTEMLNQWIFHNDHIQYLSDTLMYSIFKSKKSFRLLKGVIHKSQKNGHYNGQRQRTKGQTMIDKILHRKLKNEQHQHH
jgi:hypothetical protein